MSQAGKVTFRLPPLGFARNREESHNSWIPGFEFCRESMMLFASAESAVAKVLVLFHLPGFDEPFSAISHLVGTAIFLVLGYILLLRGRGDLARLAYLGIYAVSCVLLFSLSSVYHMTARGGPANQIMDQLDHAAIFVLIAGTFTPAYGILYRGWVRAILLLSVWTAAIAGIVLTTVYSGGLAEGMRLAFHLALGWSGIAVTMDVWRRYGFAFVRPLLVGGLITSAFAVAQLFGWPVLIPHVVHAHEVFHVAVLVGSIFHWRFIWQFANWDMKSSPPASARR
jgi:hemolysin III